MEQALHIFRKDVRHLKFEVALVLVVVAIFTWLGVRAILQGATAEGVELLLVVDASYLIIRVIHAEAIPGDRQYWITRPYRWKSLLGAKLLFILVFANLPIFLSHALVLTVGRFPLASTMPGLVWSQLLLMVCVWLPVAALAAVTARLGPAFFTASILLVAEFGLAQLMTMFRGASWQLEGLDWIRSTVLGMGLAALVTSILYLQYRHRRSRFSRSLAVGGLVVGTAVYIYLPWSLAFALQSRLAPQFDSTKLQVGLGPSANTFKLARFGQAVQIDLPIAISGLSDEVDLQANALAFTLQGPDGRTWTSAPVRRAELVRHLPNGAMVWSQTVFVARAFFNQEKDQPVTLHGSLYLTLFGNQRSKTIPIQREFVNVMDGLQCSTTVANAGWDLYCRSAFRWPARAVYAKVGSNNTNSFTQFISYSPFPAGLNLSPVETHWLPAYSFGQEAHANDVTLTVKEPTAHLRHEFEIRGVRLTDYAIPWRRRKVVRGGRDVGEEADF